MSALPLQHIEGKYEILEKIREGGMGAIYKVRHRLLDEIRVIKLMRPQLVDDQELRARFLREAQVAIKLRHPNIAQLYDFTADDDGTALIVMEFIRGKTLEDLLKTAGPPPLGLALEIAQQSLRALGYLHSKGFVHRDISPDNLMLTEDADGNPQIKLIDLGIAKILGGVDAQLTHTGTFLGKVRYASPEQFGSGGAATADARGDLYSFGVVLYELLTGAYPIAGRDPSSIMAGHLFRAPLAFEESDPQGRVPPGLRAAVLKALAKNPEERYGSTQELARDLAHFRVPDDVSPEEWKKLLEVVDEGEAPGSRPGTTQDRLDEHFGLEATPVPTSPVGVPRERTLLIPVPRSETGFAATAQVSVEAELRREEERRHAQGSIPPAIDFQVRANRAGRLPLQPASPAKEVGSRWSRVALSAVVALAVLAGATWFLRHRPSPERPSPSAVPAAVPSAVPAAAPAAAPAPAVAPLTPALNGILMVDALPWAEVAEVRDERGVLFPVPEPAVTPLALTLPAGHYTVQLRNPAFPQTVAVRVEVATGQGAQPARAVGEFRRVDVDEYLKGMRW